MKTQRRWTLAILGVLIVSAYVVPYVFLSRIESWYGSFLFWILFSLASILVISRIACQWRDPE
ncbi:hypothetical protein [Melghirimyces profundicolus]|uniref:hypothetical protein n=1 Tax=Melghirimyces profundicolus TaxID=1242148 RepID=UPI001FE65F01|nr:hypothetical protein [Melghirimyces profundicolus]